MQRKNKDWHKRELKVEIRSSPDAGYLVTLNGAITEDAASAFESMALQLGGTPESPVTFQMAGIEFLNSIGIQGWMRFLGGLGARRKVFLAEISSAMVEHVTLIAGFTGQAEILSFHLPYFCTKCRRQDSVLYLADAAPADAVPTPPQCSCGRPLSLDMMDDDYILFMEFVRPKP